jgi:hypothetical protein
LFEPVCTFFPINGVKESSRFFGPQGHLEIFIRKGEHMKNLLKPLLVAVGLGIFALVMALTNSKPVVAQTSSVPVRVTNTPLPVQGTVNANVTNSSLPVTGTVTANINSLPNVNATITNSPLSALITNPATNPVLVSNLNDSLDHEFFSNLCETDVANSTQCNAFPVVATNGPETLGEITIPKFTASGLKVTQAVIEFVSGVCLATPSDDIGYVSLILPAPSGQPFYLLPVRTASPSGASNWTFSQTTKIYAYPTEAVGLLVYSTNEFGGQQSCNAAFSATLLTQ